MKIALFGDVHANWEALEAVLADADEQGCNSYVCLGDVVGYNADPVKCLEKIREMGCPVVKGNHDEDAGGEHSLEMMNPTAGEALQWTRDQLNAEQREWLARMRMVRQIEDFTIVHSTLDQPNVWNYVTNKFDAMSNFSYQFTQVCFHGHTHVPRVFVRGSRVQEGTPDIVAIEPGMKYFINAGSVGQPRDGEWKASYCIYDTDNKTVTFRRLEYDIETTQKKILAAGLPKVLADRLSQGR
ncbi:metallophosphoesterase family protein [Rubritalea profundi]|uniref:Metallophosphatase family protein n=1 Tax=Rubritalea profundi TaxID=1658618 RepID=A0A2S7U203_9BACT|nr:metallophosphoesterase family protein [Rubritalea profundi]PQJ29018.1 metallophosphatase family protein [Rubritalea profundi]